MLRFATLIFSSILCFNLNAQTFDTVSVYFEMDERMNFEPQSLDSLFSSLKFAERCRVIGYADYVGESDYNKDLAADRAKSVARYIGKKSAGKLKVTQIKGLGAISKSSDSNELGDAKSRRVDVIVTIEHLEEIRPNMETPLEAMTIDTTQESNIVLEGVGFIPGRHYPLPQSVPQIERLLKTMRKYSTLKIEIQGFICCDYSKFDGLDNDSQTMNLSENRAKYIYDYLIREGIDAKRLSYKGYGSSRPKVFPEMDESDRQMNRRVEIKVLKN
jgi:outer membrane protein OmpA-like peptidoglycan-associated protein